MNRIVEGIHLIAKYDPESEISFHNSGIYFGDYEKTKSVMSYGDLNRLEELGWCEDEEAWATFQ